MPVTRALTLGVEEEFCLLDPLTGAVVPCGPAAVRVLDDPDGVTVESMRYMVETRSPVCHTLAELADRLGGARCRLGHAAAAFGAVVVASGVAPYGLPDPAPVTPGARYAQLALRFPHAMRTTGTCGCHVHVGVPSRQVGVEVLRRIRRWLPALVALTANSPVWEGVDSGRASQRHHFQARWPTAVPAPPVRTVGEYDDAVRTAVLAGKALDERSIYYLARLSPRYPTVEVRLADVGLTVTETVAYAGIVRGLVAMAVDDAAHGVPADAVPQEALVASCLRAADAGLTGTVPDPRTGQERATWDLVDELLARVAPHLAAGDGTAVGEGIAIARATGGGAGHQRGLFGQDPSPHRFVPALAAVTTTMAAAGL